MIETDHLLKQYFSDPARFADVYNAFLFDPSEKISPECLTDLDSEALFPEDEVNPKIDPAKLIFKHVCWEGKSLDLCLYVMAGEKDMDLSLPVTVRTIETLAYQSQLKAWRMDTKDLVLAPCEVLALYFGKEPWNKAQRLSELCDPLTKEWLKQNKQDFAVRLVTPANAKRRELLALTTDVKKILTAAKHAGETKKLAAFVSKNRERIAGMDETAKAVLHVLAGIPMDEENPSGTEEKRN